MNNAGMVGCGQRLGDLDARVDQIGHSHSAARHEIVQGTTRHELEDQKIDPGVASDVV
jgi:hypothetical protein